MINSSQILNEQCGAIARLVTELQFENNPGLLSKYGAMGKKKCEEDNLYHISSLSVSMELECTEIFAAYIEWARQMLAARHVPAEDLQRNLDYMDLACNRLLPAEVYNVARTYIHQTSDRLQQQPRTTESYFKNDNPLLAEAKSYLELLLEGNKEAAQELVTALVERGEKISTLYDHIFNVTQREIGLLWQNNIITVAHEHYCTAATQSIMSTLYPYIFKAASKKRKLVACSVSNELHEMGVRMLCDLFELEGWDTYYMGANMPEASIIAALSERHPLLFAISATMPVHVSKVQALIKRIRTNHAFDHLKIMVGGYPFLLVPDLWRKVGADSFAPDAKEAILVANNLIS